MRQRLLIGFAQVKVGKAFKILAPTWNEKFELPDGSYSASDIQNYFGYIDKNKSIKLSSKYRKKPLDHAKQCT